jgi:hypothetical protein
MLVGKNCSLRGSEKTYASASMHYWLGQSEKGFFHLLFFVRELKKN